MVTVQLHGVSAFIGSQQILGDISTPMFEAGQIIAVIGPNAAGKSSLFRRMAGLIKGDGQVEVVSDLQYDNFICYMPQDSHSNAAFTVYDSMLLSSKQNSTLRVSDDDLQHIDEILELLNISDLAFRNIGELSGGQQQLVSIAQLLIRDPRIVLMDEPTSALDIRRQIEVLEMIKKLAHDRQLIIFIALHDLNQVLRYADKVMIIEDGGLYDSGDCEQIITSEMLRKIYKIDALIETSSIGIKHVIVNGSI